MGSASALLRNGRVVAGLVILGVFVLIALAGPAFVEGVLGLSARANDIDSIAQPPSLAHPLGTTQFGQDVLAQVVEGARGSLFVGFLGAAIGTAIAIVVGVPAGYFGGATGNVLNFVTNLFIVMPVLPLIFIIAGYLQGAGLVTIAVVIGVFGWAGGARTLRAQAMSVRNRDFVQAMRVLGERQSRLVFVEVLPHLTGWIASMFLGGLMGAVMTEAGLAFLGISDSSAVSWGTMIQAAQQQSAVLRGLWWWFVPPGLCIALVGTAAVLVNFGVDEIANPKLRVPREERRMRRSLGGRAAVTAE